jgi:hypothetical protein
MITDIDVLKTEHKLMLQALRAIAFGYLDAGEMWDEAEKVGLDWGEYLQMSYENMKYEAEFVLKELGISENS